MNSRIVSFTQSNENMLHILGGSPCSECFQCGILSGMLELTCSHMGCFCRPIRYHAWSLVWQLTPGHVLGMSKMRGGLYSERGEARHANSIRPDEAVACANLSALYSKRSMLSNNLNSRCVWLQVAQTIFRRMHGRVRGSGEPEVRKMLFFFPAFTATCARTFAT